MRSKCLTLGHLAGSASGTCHSRSGGDELKPHDGGRVYVK